MRDALGGSVTLIIVVVFIVFALGYMAFNVNYTKAFRMKDKIISLYDDYNGDCISNSKCESEIKSYAEKIGYQGYDMNKCPSNFTEGAGGLYCWKQSVSNVYSTEDVGIVHPRTNNYHYTIVTRINVQIPIMNKLLDFRFLDVSGDTKTYH